MDSSCRKYTLQTGWAQQERPGEPSYMHKKTLNSIIGMRSYQQVQRILSRATQELTVLDTLPD